MSAPFLWILSYYAKLPLKCFTQAWVNSFLLVGYLIQLELRASFTFTLYEFQICSISQYFNINKLAPKYVHSVPLLARTPKIFVFSPFVGERVFITSLSMLYTLWRCSFMKVSAAWHCFLVMAVTGIVFGWSRLFFGDDSILGYTTTNRPIIIHISDWKVLASGHWEHMKWFIIEKLAFSFVEVYPDSSGWLINIFNLAE